MQDVPTATLGDVQGRLRRPKISCGECEATGSDIRLFVYGAGDRGAAVRVLCTGCGSCSDFTARWVRPQSVSAGVHEGVAKAPKSNAATSKWSPVQAATVRWDNSETLERHERVARAIAGKQGRAGRPRKHKLGEEPWVKAGMAKSTWYHRQQAKG